MLLFWLRSNATPCSWLVPDLMDTLTAAPPAAPCSASKALVVMLTVSMASDGRHVGDVHRQPRIGNRGAVEPGAVAGGGDAIHEQRVRALRIAGLRIGLARRRDAGAGNQVQEALEVLALAAVVRQFHHFLSGDLRMHVGLVGLQHGGVRPDFHGLAWPGQSARGNRRAGLHWRSP